MATKPRAGGLARKKGAAPASVVEAGTITVRNVTPALSARLKERARKRGTSVNQLVVDTLEESVGLKKQKRFTRVHDDLDDLFGKWTNKEFKEVNTRLQEQRTVDPGMWE